MPSAYVDGGGHMVAIGPIKSTLTSTTSTKLGVTKMPWGCCFILCVLARKYCQMFGKTEPLIWTSVTGTLSRDRSDLSQLKQMLPLKGNKFNSVAKIFLDKFK